jgi:hypothetical protein
MVDSDEKTTTFFAEEQWVISLNSIGENKPSSHFWVCNEDCVLLVGNDDSAQILFNKFPRLEGISRKILEHTFAEFLQKTSNYYTDSPDQRYTKLLSSQPDLIQRIPQYQLASFIGVTPESLSRIRKRIMLKK